MWAQSRASKSRPNTRALARSPPVKSIEKEIDADNKEFKRELEAAEKEAAAEQA